MSYVQLTRAEFEDWLGTMGFRRGDWQLKPGRGGVYQLFLSPTVAIEINSTTGARDEVMDVGKASMSLRLISRVNGRVLNKKAMGQSHFARTINWRDNWKKGVERMKDTYVKAKDFYDAIASIVDYDVYQKEMLALIEAKPGWQQNKFLMDLRDRLRRGGVLSAKQREALERVERAPASRTVDPPQEDLRIQALRELYSKARHGQDQWTMDFALSLAQQLKAGRTLSPKQTQILEDKMRMYRVRTAALVGTDTASIYAIAPEMLRKLLEGDRWLDFWNDGSFERADKLVRQHGGAVFHTGGDGTWDVTIPDLADEDFFDDGKGMMKPYGESGFDEAISKLASEVIKSVGWWAIQPGSPGFDGRRTLGVPR